MQTNRTQAGRLDTADIMTPETLGSDRQKPEKKTLSGPSLRHIRSFLPPGRLSLPLLTQCRCCFLSCPFLVPPRSALLSCSLVTLSNISASICHVQLPASASISVGKGDVISPTWIVNLKWLWIQFNSTQLSHCQVMPLNSKKSENVCLQLISDVRAACSVVMHYPRQIFFTFIKKSFNWTARDS